MKWKNKHDNFAFSFKKSTNFATNKLHLLNVQVVIYSTCLPSLMELLDFSNKHKRLICYILFTNEKCQAFHYEV